MLVSETGRIREGLIFSFLHTIFIGGFYCYPNICCNSQILFAFMLVPVGIRALRGLLRISL